MISHERIRQWIDEQERMLYAQHGLKIGIAITKDHIRVSSWGKGIYEFKFECANGDSVQEAVDKLLAYFPDDKQRAKDLRDQASQLMNKAAAIERGEEVK